MMKRELMTTMFRFRVTEDLDRAVKTEARRLRLKTSEVARMALARGLAMLAGDADAGGPDPQTMEVTSNE